MDDRIIGAAGASMRQLYDRFRFLFACAVILASGYFLAKPRNDADKLFAPVFCLIAVYSLWRGRSPSNPSLP